MSTAWIRPRWKVYKKIFKSLQGGATIMAACQAAAIDMSTFTRWRQKNDKLNHKVYKILECRIAIVEDALYKNAVNGQFMAQNKFLLNRDPRRWSKDPSLVINNNAPINVTNQQTTIVYKTAPVIVFSSTGKEEQKTEADKPEPQVLPADGNRVAEHLDNVEQG